MIGGPDQQQTGIDRAVRLIGARAVRFVSNDPARSIALLILISSAAAALISPIVSYDDWYYHFPFSARLWGIGGADSFHFDSHLEARWRGFPLLWEWLQGLMWFSTGSIRSMIIPQLVLCGLYLVIAARTLSVPWAWVVLGFFASPMLLIHFQSLYVDLPAGLCLATGFFLLISFIHAERLTLAATIGAVLLVGMAGNIKVQALISAIIVGFAVIAAAIAQLGWQKKTAQIVAITLLGLIISSATAISNLQRTGNPLYPFNVVVRGETIFVGPEDPMKGAMPPDYQGRGGMSVPPAPLAFMLSATELDWTLRGVPPWYSVDSRAGDRPRVGGSSRTGGWGWLFVLVNGFILIVQLSILRKEQDRLQRSLVLAAIGLITATAFIPRSHELRYWLFLPLIFLPVNLRFLQRTAYRPLVGAGLVAAMLYSASQAVLTAGTQLLTERVPLSTPRVPGEIAATLRAHGRYCSDDTLLFRYSAPVTGAPGLLSLRPEDCQGLTGDSPMTVKPRT